MITGTSVHHTKDKTLQGIIETHRSNDALQYPFVFVNGKT